MPAFFSTNGEWFGIPGKGFDAKTVCAAILLLCVAPTAATAEPITFTFQISGIRRFVDFTPPESIPGTFALRMTVSREPVFDSEHFQTYGPPRFSDIPLSIPPRPIDANRFDSFTSLGVFMEEDEEGWAAEAFAFEGFFDEGTNGLWQTQLDSRILRLSSPPDVSVHTFASILGASGAFSYLFDAPERSIRYHGTATLIDTPSTVPEPASLLLLVTGLSALGTRHWRHRRQRRIR